MADRQHNPYPNELRGFKFYRQYLAPLQPKVSEQSAVVQVLGSDQGNSVGGWRIWPLWVGDDGPEKGVLAEIEIIPINRVSMLAVNFPAAFSHSTGMVSEINITCDVYVDDTGLEYWVSADDSSDRHKGDLLFIKYGPSKSVKH